MIRSSRSKRWPIKKPYSAKRIRQALNCRSWQYLGRVLPNRPDRFPSPVLSGSGSKGFSQRNRTPSVGLLYGFQVINAIFFRAIDKIVDPDGVYLNAPSWHWQIRTPIDWHNRAISNRGSDWESAIRHAFSQVKRSCVNEAWMIP